jgi:hypothetical protein
LAKGEEVDRINILQRRMVEVGFTLKWVKKKNIFWEGPEIHGNRRRFYWFTWCKERFRCEESSKVDRMVIVEMFGIEDVNQETISGIDMNDQCLFPVTKMGWKTNRKKIVTVDANVVGKYSYVCWEMGPKISRANWIGIGPVNGLIRLLDNKLGLFLFPVDLSAEFMNFLPYSAFDVEDGYTLDWYLKREDFDATTLMNLEKIWIGKGLIAKKKLVTNLMNSIIGKEQQRILHFIPVICDDTNFKSRLWEERIRSIELEFELKEPKV